MQENVPNVVTITAVNDQTWISFDPSLIEANHIDEQQCKAREMVKECVTSQGLRACVFVDLSSMTWSKVVSLLKVTNSKQRDCGIDVFRHVLTDAVKIRMHGNLGLKWFVKRCVHFYVSSKVKDRITFV